MSDVRNLTAQAAVQCPRQRARRLSSIGQPSSPTPTTSATRPPSASPSVCTSGASVTDPQALDNARKLHPELDYADDPIAAVQDADLLLHLTEWPQFSHVDPHRLAVTHRHPEGRRRPRHARSVTWREADWTFRALGRP
ncbi:hypothetical protein ACF1A9_19520 [Streptomyces sp. NPDC014872]|uniref:hypothetical protein n=1 Tax=Streptomyces sp. NPDC014872 TaxID=3364926 RepID=UPI0036F5A17E